MLPSTPPPTTAAAEAPIVVPFDDDDDDDDADAARPRLLSLSADCPYTHSSQSWDTPDRCSSEAYACDEGDGEEKGDDARRRER